MTHLGLSELNRWYANRQAQPTTPYNSGRSPDTTYRAAQAIANIVDNPTVTPTVPLTAPPTVPVAPYVKKTATGATNRPVNGNKRAIAPSQRPVVPDNGDIYAGVYDRPAPQYMPYMTQDFNDTGNAAAANAALAQEQAARAAKYQALLEMYGLANGGNEAAIDPTAAQAYYAQHAPVEGMTSQEVYDALANQYGWQ